MPEITTIGWIHTGLAIVALAAGFYTLVVYKVITPRSGSGRLYLVCTFIVAVTALMIYQRGTFGPGHALAILTLLALAAGLVVTRIPFLKAASPYLEALCFSATLLFHMIPAITDGLLRLPVGDPVLSDPTDPILRNFYLLFLAVFIVGYVFQFLWLKKQPSTDGVT